MTAPLRSVCLSLLLLSPLTGCGVGTVGIVSASDGGGTVVQDRVPTDLAVVSPSGDQNGLVRCQLALQLDPAEAIVLEAAEFSLDGAGGEFSDATPAAGYPTEILPGQSLSGTALAARKVPLVGFVWNSFADLDALRAEGELGPPASGRSVLRFRIRNTTTSEVFTAQTSEFLVNHSLVATVAGGGAGDGLLAGEASMLEPTALALTPGGDLVVADKGNHRLRRLLLSGGEAVVVETIAGNGFKGIEAGLRRSTGTSMEGPFAVVAVEDVILDLERDDTGAAKLRVVFPDRALINTAIDDLPGLTGIASREDGTVYSLDGAQGMLYAYDSVAALSLGVARVFDLGMDHTGLLEAAPAAAAEVLFVAGIESGRPSEVRVRRVELDGDQIGSVQDFAGGGGALPSDAAIMLPGGLLATELFLNGVDGLAATGSHLFYSDSVAGVVAVIERASGLVVNAIEGLESPTGLAVDAEGRLYVAESGSTTEGAFDAGHRILRVDQPTELDEVVVVLACEDVLRGLADGGEAVDGNPGDVEVDQGGG